MAAPWTQAAREPVGRGEPVALVMVAAVAGSAPREAGAKMLVTPAGIHGTVGGGALERTLIDQARLLLAGDETYLTQDYPLGPLLAQCCGGHVRVLIAKLSGRDEAWLAQAGAFEAAGARYALHCRIGARGLTWTCRAGWPEDGEGPGVLLLDAGGVAVAAAAGGRKAPWSEMIEYVRPPGCAVYLFGAGHVGRRLAAILQTLPLRLHWYDSRPECEGAIHEPDPVAQVRAAPAGALFLVLTHSHDLDFELTRAALARGDSAYCGLIGSKTKRARFAARLAARGIGPEVIAGLTCPIGAIGLTSKEPAVIALAVAAEIMLRIEEIERKALTPAYESAPA